MMRSTHKFGSPWSTVKSVSFPRPRRLQNSGASRRGSVVGSVFSHLMSNSLTSRNSKIEFPFTITDQENLRIAVQEQTKSQLPTTSPTGNIVSPLQKKGSKKFGLSLSNLSNISSNSRSSDTNTCKKSKKSNTPTIFLITIEDKHQILSITRQITDFVEFDQQLRQEFPKSRPTLPSLNDRRRSFLLPKHFFFRKSTAEKLESYLRKVLSDINLRSSAVLKDFLSVKHEKDGIKWKDPLNMKPEISTKIIRTTQQHHKATIEDYDLIKVLGKGCMGKVFLSREKRSNKLYALKVISKEWAVRRQEVDHTKTERDILVSISTISHPFLISLRESYQDVNHLFLVLDYYPGGDIATQLAKYHKFDDARCLFYATEIVLGIEELHRLGIVYRDLKPENILIGRDGHIVLTDFGLSKQFKPNWQKTNTFCGTAEYLAPEIIRGDQYSYPVDWWSLGTLLYEMMTGITPFWASDQNKMYRRVLEDKLEFPDNGMTFQAMDLLRGLLQRDPSLRLGCGLAGAMEIRGHIYFEYVDWNDVYHKRTDAPYKPTIEHETDLRNFDDTFVSMTPKLSIPRQELDSNAQQYFVGYSFSERLSSRPSSSSHFRGSMTSSLAVMPSQGSRSSIALPGYDKEDYEYNNDIYSGMLYSNTMHAIASDDISEYELDPHLHYPKRHTKIFGDNNMKYRNHHYQNSRLSSQFMDEDQYGGNGSSSSSTAILDRRGNYTSVFPT